MSYLTGNYITSEGLENIKNHKYKPGEVSRAEKILEYFWTWCVNFLPRTMAPNTVTMLGLVSLCATYAFMMGTDLRMTSYPITWTCLVTAIGIFLFQTFDGIDGKQARRTNSSSPLGQLFDHGLDGISWTVISLSLVSLLGCGLSYEGVLCMLGTWTPLYLTHLLEYYTGVFEYSIGNIDGTTGILITISLHLLPVFFGKDFYDIKCKDAFTFLPNFITRDFAFRDLALLFVVYVGVLLSVFVLYYLFKAQKDKKSVFILSLQVLQNLLSYVILFSFDTKIEFVRNNLGLFYIMVTLIYNIVLVKLVVCLMAKMNFQPLHLEYLTFLIYFYFQSKYDGSSESEDKLRYSFYVTFGILAVLYFRLMQSCINQLTTFLNIYCFSIEKKAKSE